MTNDDREAYLDSRLQARRRYEAARDGKTPATVPTDTQVWTPTSAVLERLRLPLSAAMDRQTRDRDVWSLASGQDGTHVNDVRVENVQGPSFIMADPHTDHEFPRYFILYVLSGDAPKVLQGWDSYTVRNILGKADRPKRPAQEVPLVPGQMVVFDAHQVHGARLVDAQDRALLKRVHRMAQRHDGMADTLENLALTKGVDTEQVYRLLTRCLCLETDTRPSPEQAEAMMQAHVLENAPGLCADLGLEASAPAARRRKPGF